MQPDVRNKLSVHQSLDVAPASASECAQLEEDVMKCIVVTSDGISLHIDVMPF